MPTSPDIQEAITPTVSSKDLAKVVIGAASVLAGCGPQTIVETQRPTATPEQLTIDAATAAIHAWDTFTNGVNNGSIREPLTCATSPDDATGTRLQGFNPANPDGTPNKTIEYGFCSAPVTIDGKEEGAAVFLVKQESQTKKTEAFILLLEGEGAGPEGTWAAGKIDADHHVKAAGFKVVFDGTNFFIVSGGQSPDQGSPLGVADHPENTNRAVQSISKALLNPSARPTQTFNITPTPDKPTPVPTIETPKPSWQTALEAKYPLDNYFIKVVDGTPTIDLYDTPTAERIVLGSLDTEFIKVVETTDSGNPKILTATSTDENGIVHTYALNPDHGWFALPDVQLDYNKLEAYTPVTQAFVEDGRANITTALLYAEHPTISPNAITPVYWVGYNNFVKIPMLCNNACGLRVGNDVKYPQEFVQMRYDAATKPFAWTGFYKVHLDNGESIYMVARTLKNPSDTNPKQTINLFYGFDKQLYENMVNYILPTGETALQGLINGTNKGGSDIVVVLAPPERFDDGTAISYDPNVYNWREYYNPTISGLETRGQLIALFKNPAAILKIIQTGQQQQIVEPLTEPIPNAFSRFILFAKFVNR